ncbi:LuxR C-terminal-related transcriptional regulator [Catenulispora yoronensis]
MRAARLVGGAFPDAHLYADLGGYVGTPAPVPDVLRRFLRALGADGPLPDDPDELVGMFRTALAGQRVLMVLDDAADEAQVRPLLPAGPDALAIVTSRNWLGGLAGAVPLRLGPMPEAEAAAMLARILGARWTGEEDATDLLALCGHLPLAIRIAAARLLSRPQMTVEDLCDQLRDEGRRLRRLRAGDITVHGVLTSSYDALEAGDRKVFRRLGLLRGYDFCAEAASQAAGLARDEAQEALDRLTDRSVVRAEAAPGRYSLHSLARLFAADRLAADEDAADVRAAEARHLEWVLNRLHTAADLINPCLVRLPRDGAAHPGGAARTDGTALADGAGTRGTGSGSGSVAGPGSSPASSPGSSSGSRSRSGSGSRSGSSPDSGSGSDSGSDSGPGSEADADPGPDPAGGPAEAGPPGPTSRDAALIWLDVERHNLLALVRHHRRKGDQTVCWIVSDALRGYFHARRNLREWTRMAGIGLAAARHAGDLRAQAAMHLNLGLAAYSGGRLDQAEEHYHRTVELGLGTGWREGEAAAYRNLAGVALLHGDPAASEKYLSLWADLNAVLGQCPDSAAEIAQCAADLGDAETGDWERLSHREQTVARLVVQGLTNQQIAKRIRCSPETVKFHLRNIFRKLEIGSRVEIARFVLSPGRAAPPGVGV